MNTIVSYSLTLAALLATGTVVAAETVWLDDLDLSKTDQQWGSPGKNQSVDGHKLTIAKQTFARGLGTHAESTLVLDLNAGCESFFARVGAWYM